MGCALHDSADPAVSNATGSDPRPVSRTQESEVKMPALLLVLVKRHLPRGVLGIAIKPHPQSPSLTKQDPRPS